VPGDLRVALKALVAEDQMLLRAGLSRILEAGGIAVAEAVGSADTLAEALKRDDLDIAIVDVRLPPTFTTEGLEAVVKARSSRPGLPVLVLSQYVEPLYARELLAAGTGSVGYLLKDRVVDVDGFVAAVRQVAAGGTVLDPEVVAGLLSARPLDRLTDREREVLTLMAEGRSNAAIATRLYVTEKAVDKHINNIFTKLDLPPAPDDNRRVLAVLAWLNAVA
jgi:DNA-binding NarL/FixJ family response regulator